MRSLTAIKIVGLVALGLGASVLTSSLLGQQSPKPKGKSREIGKAKAVAQAPKLAENKVGPLKKITPEEMAERARRMADPEFQAREFHAMEDALRADRSVGSDFTSREMSVVAKGNEVSIAARVWMYEARPAKQYRWTLRVHERSRKLTVIDRDYNDQIFTLPAGKLMDPTFNEVVRLAPGEYSVEIILDGFTEGFDLTKLKDRDIERQQRVLSNIQRVTVGR